RSPPSWRLYGGSAKTRSTLDAGSCSSMAMQSPCRMVSSGRGIGRTVFAGAARKAVRGAAAAARRVFLMGSALVRNGTGLPSTMKRLGKERVCEGGRRSVPAWDDWPARPKADRLAEGLEHAEGAPVVRGRAVSVDGGAMLRRGIAHVALEAIGREGRPEPDHQAVTSDFGDDRGGRDGRDQGIAVDDGACRADEVGRYIRAIDLGQPRPQCETGDGAPHGVEGRYADVEAVDGGGTRKGDRDGHGAALHQLVEPGALLGA